VNHKKLPWAKSLLPLLVATALSAQITTIQLPDARSGSRANSIVIDVIGAGFVPRAALVAGEGKAAGGRLLPVCWTIDPIAQTAAGAILPVPPGARGRANGIVIDVIGAGIIAGTVTTPNGRDHAVVWKQTSATTWQSVALPDAGFGSRATNILIDFTGAGVIATGSGELANGRTVPVYWTVDTTTGNASAAILKLPSGATGASNQIVIDFTGAGVVAGEGARRGDTTRPLVWELGSNGISKPVILPIPNNATGSAKSVAEVNGVRRAVGTVDTANGVRHAVLWSASSSGWAGQPLPGFGFGNRANNIVIDFTGAGVIAGEALASGQRNPILWSLEPGGAISSTMLPLPANSQGEATDAFYNPSKTSSQTAIIVGIITNSSGVDRAVAWVLKQ
jgi:hypothetical protein